MVTYEKVPQTSRSEASILLNIGDAIDDAIDPSQHLKNKDTANAL